ncbi:MAG: hypothetical protein HDR85_01815 [Bacteroides sp.]|nr:hypothetical protein [Bacteroides sp.]
MGFTEHILGVKILDNFIAIEICDTFGDLNKYDFIYTDYLSSNYNGNTSYSSKIRDIKNGQDYYIINGWKLLSINFPGNWFGNFTYVHLEDRFGRGTSVQAPVNQAIYPDSFKHLIREGLLEALRFTKDTPCVEYEEIIQGLKPVSGSMNIEQFHKLVESVDTYITKYRELRSKLTNEELSSVDDKLKVAVSENISKLFGLSIKIE